MPMFMTCFYARLSPKYSRDSDNEGDDENESHYCEGENPLDTKNLRLKLPNPQTGHNERHGKANVIILKHKQEEQREDKEVPDGNIGEDSAGELLTVDHDSTVPEDGVFDPNYWQGHSREVNPAWSFGVAEIQSYELAPVYDQYNF